MPGQDGETLKPWWEYHKIGAPAQVRTVRGTSGIQGEGTFAFGDIPENYVLGEVIGPICPEPYNSKTCVFRTEDTCLEPTDAGVPVHRMNHSCDPNCELDHIEEPGFQIAVTVFSLRAIKAGEELTIDYMGGWKDSPFVDESGQPLRCHCGAANCRGYMVDPDEIPEALRVQQ